MIAVIDAQLAWCPPTFRPSRFWRIWFALWIIHEESQSNLLSNCSKAVIMSCRAGEVVESIYRVLMWGLYLARHEKDRKRVVSGRSVSVRVDLGGRRIIRHIRTEAINKHRTGELNEE